MMRVFRKIAGTGILYPLITPPTMTNSRLILTGLFGLATLAAPVSLADTVAGTPDATVQLAPNKVGAAIAALPLLNGATPNTTARYYIYLCSAGWCGPCNREMPHVVEAYKGIRESGLVELLLVDFDHSEGEAKAFVEKYGVTFPATMSAAAVGLPGYKEPRGVPLAFIVDAEGNLVFFGHGSRIKYWQTIISQYEKGKGLTPSFPEGMTITLTPRIILADAEEDTEAAADDVDSSATAKPGNAVASALNKVKWFNGKPNKKAKYYIYLQSASWCGPCCAEMPHIAKEYREMKKSRRVELVLLSGDRTMGAAKAFQKDNNAKFPGVLRSAAGVSELPGVDKLPNYYPAAVIVKADGTVVTSGHGSLVLKWREYTLDAGKKGEDSQD